MLESFLNFKDPINRSDYLVQFLKRALILIIIWSIYNLLFMSWNSISITNDSFWENLFEDHTGIEASLGTILYLPLDIRRAKDINISINWIYIVYFLNFLPFPENNFENGGSVSNKLEILIYLFIASFSIFLFIKKGSNSKSRTSE